MFENAWADEANHQDDLHPRLAKEKLAGGRARLARRYAAALRRHASPAAIQLADLLRSCRIDERCGSGVCPQCMVATRRAFVSFMLKKAEQHSVVLQATLLRPALIPLRSLDMSVARADLAAGLLGAGLGPVPTIGALDLCHDTYSGAVSRSGWLPHWTVFFPDCDRDALKAQLDTSFPSAWGFRLPVKVTPIRSTPHIAFSYAYKAVFDFHDYAVDSSGRYRRVNSGIIQPQQRLFMPLALNLHRIGLAARFYQQGLF